MPDDHITKRRAGKTSQARRLRRNEAEQISKDWASAGCDVLLHAVLETAEMVA